MGIAYRGTNSLFFEIVDQKPIPKYRICKRCGKRFYEEGYPLLKPASDRYTCNDCLKPGGTSGHFV